MSDDLEPWEIPGAALSEGTCPLANLAGTAVCGERLIPERPTAPYRQAGMCPVHRARFRWNPSYEPQEIAS